ncbi:hypothetical protein DHEL01_v207003 [Diaporthe helianthi]|uniref:Uncharacterized protein n=1 Tax=Diaporthe helianthi TaxID=158607 RepID=A0A2P5HWJ1_DIAHE|nr:hypothetical protein DHEL01_v207003 [Diaporthe helianthi]
MEAGETTDPVGAEASEADTTKPNEAASSQPPETNGHEENKTAVEQDEDAIEYEKPKVKKRGDTDADPESDLGSNSGSQVKARKRKSRESTESEDFEPEPAPEPLKFDVVIQPLPPAAAQEYTKVNPGDEIFRVLDIIKTDVPGEAWLSVEFEDGRVDQVSRNFRTRFVPGQAQFCSAGTNLLHSFAF